MKVLMVSEAKAFGGAEIYLEFLASGLKQGESRIAYPALLEDWGRRLGRLGVETLPYRSPQELIPAARSADVVHLNLPHTYDGAAGRLVSILARSETPVVATEHLVHGSLFPRLWLRKKLSYGAVKATICLTQSAARVLKKRGFGRVHVVANGVPDVLAPAPFAQGPLQAAILGSLESRKNVGWILEALRDVSQVDLRIAGEGPEKRGLQTKVRELGMDSRVEFRGWVDDPYAFLNSCHVLLMASELEGMPLSILQSMAVGRPVVAVELPVLGELMGGRALGELVPRNPQAFAEAVRALDADRNRLAGMGAAARQRYLDQYTLETQIAKTEQVYRSVAGR